MNKMTYMLAVLSAAALMTSCSSEENLAQEDSTQDGKTIALTIEATRGETSTTRTAMSSDDDYYTLVSQWSEGDVIHVYSKKTGTDLGTLTLTTESSSISTEGPTSATDASISTAQFKGSITLGTGDAIGDAFAFVYQGSGMSLTPDANGNLSYTLVAKTSVSDLNAFDIAWASGKITGTDTNASASVAFANKMAFGYFTTADVTTEAISFDYYSSFTLNVIKGEITPISGTVSLPAGSTFYLPLIPGKQVSMSAKKWNATSYAKDCNDLKFSEYYNSIKFTPAAGGYYRMKDTHNPLAFNKTERTWNTLTQQNKNSVFTVALGKTVSFTQGNLQYIYVDGTNNYWRFAPSQYSYIGSNNAHVAGSETTFMGSMDLFGWGAIPGDNGYICGIANNDYYPCGTGTSQTWSGTSGQWDPATSYDWGQYIKTNNKTIWIDKTNNVSVTQPTAGYRVLTTAEWGYLFNNRTFSDDASTKMFAYATVTLSSGSQVKGVVVFPDGVKKTKATEMGFNTFGGPNNYVNTINQSVIDDNGLLFLPAAGYRNGASIGSVGSCGGYWSSSAYSAAGAYNVIFNSTYFNPQCNYNRYVGFSVRLVQDN